MSPLAPLALHSPMIAHALTGECAGDCSRCACSVERSANHTCCCWQKKQLLQHDEDQEQSDCCMKNKATEKPAATVSSLPCSSSKTMMLMGVLQSDVLPYRFNQENLVLLEVALVAPNPDFLTSRTGDPPDPPPKINSIS